MAGARWFGSGDGACVTPSCSNSVKTNRSSQVRALKGKTTGPEPGSARKQLKIGLLGTPTIHGARCDGTGSARKQLQIGLLGTPTIYGARCDGTVFFHFDASIAGGATRASYSFLPESEFS